MENKTVDKLEECKSDLIKTYDRYSATKSTNFDFNSYITDEEYRECRKIILKLCKEQELEEPLVLVDCRTVEEFIKHLTFNNHPFGEDVNNVAKIFNSVIDYIDLNSFEIKIVRVNCEVPEELSYKHILDDIKKCDERIDMKDYTGAITSAKTLLEGVCKEIVFNVEGKKIDGAPNLPSLFNMVRAHLNLDPSKEELQKPLKDVLSGLIKVVHGLNEVRNLSGDGHSIKVTPSFHHALVVVNSAKTVVNFLFHTYEYQRDLGKIKVKEISTT